VEGRVSGWLDGWDGGWLGEVRVWMLPLPGLVGQHGAEPWFTSNEGRETPPSLSSPALLLCPRCGPFLKRECLKGEKVVGSLSLLAGFAAP